MTFYFDFYAEQAFLLFIKDYLSSTRTATSYSDYSDAETSHCAVCILACAATIEAMVNRLFIQKGCFKHFDELRLKSKIETLADVGGVSIDWGKGPWQQVAELIKARNWLAHFKDTTIGLIGAEDTWVVDDINKPPKLDPKVVLTPPTIRKYYDALREALRALAAGLEVNNHHYDFLDSEHYNLIVVG